MKDIEIMQLTGYVVLRSQPAGEVHERAIRVRVLLDIPANLTREEKRLLESTHVALHDLTPSEERDVKEVGYDVGQSIDDGRRDVAEALVEAVYGGWHDHPPYTDLAQEIVDDPSLGVKAALEERDRRREAFYIREKRNEIAKPNERHVIGDMLLRSIERGARAERVKDHALEIVNSLHQAHGAGDDADRLFLYALANCATVTPVSYEAFSVGVSPRSTIDSDDFAAWLGAYLKALDYDVRVVLVRQSGMPYFHHVYVQAKRKNETVWRSFDPHAGKYKASETQIVVEGGK